MVEWFGMTGVAEKAVQPCSSRVHSEFEAQATIIKHGSSEHAVGLLKRVYYRSNCILTLKVEMSNTERRVTIKRHTIISTPTPS